LGGRNSKKSVTRPQPPRGNAEVSGRRNRPRHSRWYALSARRARGAQPRRLPRDGRAKIRSCVKSVISASLATAGGLTRKPPALPQGTGCPPDIFCAGNRRSAPRRSAAPWTKPETLNLNFFQKQKSLVPPAQEKTRFGDVGTSDHSSSRPAAISRVCIYLCLMTLNMYSPRDR
jgi:hypothetical protein